MSDQSDRLEVHAVVGVAVGATDALAVGGERGRGAVGHRARRGPTSQHLLQRVGVGVGEHPASVESDGATQRPASGSRHALSARSSS